METFQMWHIIFVVVTGLTYWILLPLAMWTPAWVIIKVNIPCTSSMFNERNAPVSPTGSQPSLKSTFDHMIGELAKNGALEKNILERDYGMGCLKVELQHGLMHMNTKIGETSYIGTRHPPYTYPWSMDHGPITFLLLAGSQLFLFIAWVWGLSIFCCRCCRFYTALPLFSGFAFVLAMGGVITYVVQDKDSNDFPLKELTCDSLSDICDKKFGYSFIIAILVVVILGLAIAMGIYIACAPKGMMYPPNNAVQPTWLREQGPYSYDPAQGQPTYPASYYNKPNMGQSQQLQYPIN